MKITPYQSENGKWLALMDFDNNTFMPFFGASKADAVNRAEAFLEREKARWLRADSSGTENLTSERPAGKGQVFLGKVWMLNRETGERARVDAGEVAGFESRGYVRGGPRSK